MHDTVQPGPTTAAASPSSRVFALSGRARAAASVLTIVAVALTLIVGGTYIQASRVTDDFRAARVHLTTDIAAAQKDGLTTSDLGAIAAQLDQIDGSRLVLPGDVRLAFNFSDSRAINQLDGQLRALREQILTGSTSGAAAAVAAAETAVGADDVLGMPQSDLGPLQQRLADLKTEQSSAGSIKSWRDVEARATRLHDDAVAAGSFQARENSAIQAAATALVQSSGGDVGKVQAAGNAALVSGRNDASIAAYEGKAGRFPKLDALMTDYNRIEFYAPKMGTGDVNAVALAAAAVQRYTGNVHQVLMDNLGSKHIIVSFQDQHMWAYEGSKLVEETLVTTGIRGDTAYGTDFGPMKVLVKSHPWKFHSPWPRGTPHWYPDTTVQWTVFFTISGEAFHDAYWQPDSTLGPGSQYNAWTRSHGCIHLSFNLAEQLFNWADVGTPVDVYPGNGQPVSEQLSEMTTDNNGVPLNPA